MSNNDYLWSITHDIALNYDFNLLAAADGAEFEIDDTEQIVNLNKVTRKEVIYIRLATLGYIWPNHIQNDMLQMEKVAQQVSGQLRGKSVRLINLYIFSQTPSAEVVQVLQDNQLVTGKKTTIHFGYVDVQQKEEKIPPEVFAKTPLEREIFVERLTQEKVVDRAEMQEKIREHNAEEKRKLVDFFGQGKPLVTIALIVINALFFLAMTLAGGSTDTEVLLNFGAKETFLIKNGEYWRLIMPMFLHIGITHFLFNNLAIYFLGRAVEKIFGSIRFLIIYLGSGIAGNIVSMILSPDSIAAGASGAVYGLFGALLYFGFIYPKLFFSTVGRDIIVILGINIIFGFTAPNIDFFAHFGGLFAGFLVAALTHMPRGDVKRKLWLTILSVLLLIGLGGATVYAVQDEPTTASASIYMIGQNALQEGDTEKAEEIFSFLVESYPDEPLFNFFYGNTLLTIEDFSGAIEQYELALEKDANFPEVYYNLALIELFNDNYSGAIELLEKTLELEPGFTEAAELIEQIEQDMRGF